MATPMSSIQLQPPGVGLPFIERVVGKGIIFYKAHRTSFEQSSRLFDEERHKILRLIGQLPDAARAKRVLVPRLQGLEDSSRHWSPYMVLEHLSLVNAGTLDNITSLVNGRQPDQEVCIEDVKPDHTLDEDVIQEFNAICDTYLKNLTIIKSKLKTPLTLKHPWFGPMNAAQWHFMMSVHMTIHRRQLEAMVKRLNLPA